MVWFIFAILGALLSATYYASIKGLLRDINQYVLASGAFLSCFLILFLTSIIKGLPEIGPAFYTSVLVTVIINIIGVILALVTITINIAYTMQIASYVISLKRLSILFSVFYGGLIFKEKHILKKGLAALIMLTGAVMVILF